MTSKTSSNCDELLICSACATQFDSTDPGALTSCHICNDPRQYVPPSGQTFTTLRAIKASTSPYHTNKHVPFPCDDRFISITTEPKIGIGQRAILIRTPAGNVLWDCIPYLSADTISYISSLGGLKAIIISHPHFYTTHLLWASTFNCPVYMSREDEEHLSRADPHGHRKFIQEDQTELEIGDTGVKAIKLGGHFPGSLVALYEGRLMVADTLLITPAGIGNWRDRRRPMGMNSFTFMWSIPNVSFFSFFLSPFPFSPFFPQKDIDEMMIACKKGREIGV
jgi:Metallo-beta-lactamase superfamily